uniref:Mobile element protein n=1 Tax=Macrostomum lignano TaxID=282301 RepID=A0A1I8GF10_9PLAT
AAAGHRAQGLPGRQSVRLAEDGHLPAPVGQNRRPASARPAAPADRCSRCWRRRRRPEDQVVRAENGRVRCGADAALSEFRRGPHARHAAGRSDAFDASSNSKPALPAEGAVPEAVLHAAQCAPADCAGSGEFSRHPGRDCAHAADRLCQLPGRPQAARPSGVSGQRFDI